MEKHDYVICSWCRLDAAPNPQYNYLYNITYNEAVEQAKLEADTQTLKMYRKFIYKKIMKELNESLENQDFSDIYDKTMNECEGFKIWEVLPETPEIAYSEYDFNPDVFCRHWCVHVG